MFKVTYSRSRSYTAVDDLPAHIDTFLYKQLEEWEFDGGSNRTTFGPGKIVRLWLTFA